MLTTQQTLLEQLRITDIEIEHRKALLGFTHDDAAALASARSLIDRQANALVNAFYEAQTRVPEIALLIGDVDTLRRLSQAQRRYVLDLFCGVYDAEYVNNRLRIGLVHKRIGVDPKIYLAAVHMLRAQLGVVIADNVADGQSRRAIFQALDKLFFFDVTLVFDTYIRSMMQEIDAAKTKVELYALSLEKMVCDRTQQLQELSRTDPLTRLYNRRHLVEAATHALRAAKRRNEPITLVYFDVNDFKAINDRLGHLHGDDVLSAIGELLRSAGRSEDLCFRYGGDEFLVLLPNCAEAEARNIYWTRFQASVAERLQTVSLSIGLCQTGPDDYLELDDLIRVADERMYENKRQSQQLASSNIAILNAAQSAG